jgi:hypothetical protein
MGRNRVPAPVTLPPVPLSRSAHCIVPVSRWRRQGNTAQVAQGVTPMSQVQSGQLARCAFPSPPLASSLTPSRRHQMTATPSGLTSGVATNAGGDWVGS